MSNSIHPNTKNALARRTAPEPPPVDGARWIPLTRGLFALVDKEDYERVIGIAWSAMKGHRTMYAVNNKKRALLHRLIMDAPDGMQVDHIDGNGLNCRKKNMRICTVQQNHCNLGVQSTYCGRAKSSRFRGVSYYTERGNWVAGIVVHGKRTTLGYRNTEEAAARLYDEHAKKNFGEFAKLNFPESACE